MIQLSLLTQFAAANTAPVAVNDNFTTPEDQPLAIPLSALLANDTDADGDPLSLTVLSIAGGNGSLMFLNSTTIRYTPPPDYHGSATFSYTIDDAHGGGANGTVTILMTPVVDPPANVLPTSATVVEDTLTPLNGLGLQAVDYDDVKLSLTLNVNLGKLFLTIGPGILTGNGTSNLTVYGTGSQLTTALANLVKFLPPTNYSGSVSFTMSLTDNGNLDGIVRTDTDALTLTVTPVNDAPVAAPDYFTTGINQSLAIPLSALLANDTDVDGDPLSLTVLSIAGVNGSLMFINSSTIRYIPPPNFNGSATFSYTIDDAHGGGANGTVTILVANRPTLTTPVLNHGKAQFYLNGEANTKYQLQTSSNLVNWTEWFTLTPSATNTFLEDTAAGTASKRFYRALIVQ